MGAESFTTFIILGFVRTIIPWKSLASRTKLSSSPKLSSGNVYSIFSFSIFGSIEPKNRVGNLYSVFDFCNSFSASNKSEMDLVRLFTTFPFTSKLISVPSYKVSSIICPVMFIAFPTVKESPLIGDSSNTVGCELLTIRIARPSSLYVDPS